MVPRPPNIVALSQEFTLNDESIKRYVEIKMTNCTCQSDKKMHCLILHHENMNLIIDDWRGFDLLQKHKKQCFSSNVSKNNLLEHYLHSK